MMGKEPLDEVLERMRKFEGEFQVMKFSNGWIKETQMRKQTLS